MKIKPGASVQLGGKLIEWPPFPQAEHAIFCCSPLPGKKWVCIAPGFGQPGEHGHGSVVVTNSSDLIVSDFIEDHH